MISRPIASGDLAQHLNLASGRPPTSIGLDTTRTKSFLTHAQRPHHLAPQGVP